LPERIARHGAEQSKVAPGAGDEDAAPRAGHRRTGVHAIPRGSAKSASVVHESKDAAVQPAVPPDVPTVMTGPGVAFEDVREGHESRRTYRISPEVYEGFLAISDDRNPVHVDDAVALQQGFPGRVMHGAILNAFVSHFVGMHFPAGSVLLHSVSLQYKTPSHLGDEVEIVARVSQVVESVRALVLDVVITNRTRDRVAARGKVQVGIA
jgi:acyl dehydratase